MAQVYHMRLYQLKPSPMVTSAEYTALALGPSFVADSPNDIICSRTHGDSLQSPPFPFTGLLLSG